MPDLSVLIVDDDTPAVNLLVQYVAGTPGLRVKAIAHTGDEAAALLKTAAYDLVFLDIHMPGHTGMELLGDMEALENKPLVVMTTASREHAPEALDLGIADYLVKPITEERFRKSVHRAMKLKGDPSSKNKLQNLTLEIRGESLIIPYDDILYLMSRGRHTVIYTKRREIEVPKAMKLLEKLLPTAKFIRVHKQYILSLRSVDRLKYNAGGAYQAFLKHDTDFYVPVGSKFAGRLKESLGLAGKK